MTMREGTPTRYSCHEAREDSEMVLSNRATGGAQQLYEDHLRSCRECRRMHRLLYAIYEGPQVPAPPTGVREEREFHAILRRMKEERPEPWTHKLSVRLGVGALATSAAVLALALFDVAPSLPTSEESTAPRVAVAEPSADEREPAIVIDDGDGGIDHPAQSYGRVVGGYADIVPPGGAAGAMSTFPVGTHFEVDPSDSLQIGLVGKIVANFTPGSAVDWTAASPTLLELELERGIAAVRYDRRPSDPILQIRTPSAVVRVIGTVFTVQVDAKDNTVVSVLRGHVEVLHPKSNRLLAEVESGYRFDVARSTFDDVGKLEVAAALPLSNDPGDEDGDGSEALALADGRIPGSWNVPGLPEDPQQRTLEYVPARPSTVGDAGVMSPVAMRPAPAPSEGAIATPARAQSRRAEDEGSDLLERLMADAAATRRKELRGALETCRDLYISHETRYRAARCLSNFIDKHGDDPLAVEGYLLVGMLRMDYALDYTAAEVAFQTFLRRAPNHPSAEFALYRMWLASTEKGRISEALQRGRKYLERYPNGKYVGKVLQRFPELKSEI